MKYLLIFLILFVPANPALAAQKVPGSVPVVQPLQPLPAGVAPNVRNNIQFHDPSHAGEFDASGNVVSGQGQQAPGADNAQNAPLAGSALPSAQPKSGRYIWWILSLLALAGLGWLAYKQNKAK